MTAQTILPANSVVDTGYNVDNSCRFDRASSDDFTKTSSGGSKRKATFSAWLKWGIHVGTSTEQGIFESHDGTNYFSVYTDGKNLRANNTGGTGDAIYSTQVLRDPSAWYHVVIAVDSEQSTASNRFRMYINGSEVTSFSAAVYPTEDEDMKFNGSGTIQVGGGAAGNWDGYMAEVVWIDGLQLTPTSFGEFDEDSPTIWKPIDVSGLTFGNNGFYQEYKQAGTGTNSSGMGADTSGNDNHFAVNNLTAVDQSTDTCTNNHATLNPLENFYAQSTFANGNTTLTTDTNYSFNTSTLGFSKGKYYWEAKITATNNDVFGITGRTNPSATTNELGHFADGWGFKSNDGAIRNNNTDTSYTSAFNTNGNIVQIAVDITNLKLYLGVNGTWQVSSNPSTNTGGVTIGAISTTTNGLYFVGVGDYSGGTATYQFNFGNGVFGSTPLTGTTYSDTASLGIFKYDVPAGYYALCTKNINTQEYS